MIFSVDFFFVVAVFDDARRPLGRRVVLPDGRLDSRQRQHRPHAAGVERGDWRVHPRAVRARFHRPMHVPTRKRVS